ncbi:MAG: preprotein translocase subunit SecA [Candidatus Latescibacterota bacterium]|nr:MAG: preprotein translocase subunit SecA [Candidatus Latescibacterota bacterium]
MLKKILRKFVKTKSQRDFRRMQPVVAQVNEFARQYEELSDEELRAKTEEFRGRLADGESLDDLLPEAFAAVKATCTRLCGRTWDVVGRPTEWNMVPYDVQIVGGIALHEGQIAEMATGEGKTLVATLPLYLNALTGRGAFLVTVNDYLARRDSEWMGEVFKFLGLSVGVIQNQMRPEERKAIYEHDIVYVTNNELGFDYLRDNMATRQQDRVHRDYTGDKPGKHFNFAIVDEVDSVLVDEARTPLIIAGPAPESDQNAHFMQLKPGIEQLVRVQNRQVTSILKEVDELLEPGLDEIDGDAEREVGFRLLQVKRATPKNKQYMKLVSREGGVLKLVQRVEGELMRDKMLHTADEDLYFAIDEKSHIADLTEKGREELAKRVRLPLTLPDLSLEVKRIEDDEGLSKEEKIAKLDELHRNYAQASDSLHDISQLLKAYSLFEKDDEYIVQDGKVMIVDEFTGRLMPGRRFSDGLHQALEAKENVRVERETQTMATVTLQNLFRMFEKLAGMTGTAETESEELKKIYDLDVMVIPTHRPVRRIDFDDQIYKTRREKYNAVIEEIIHQNERGMPVLVGTVSVEVSETLSRMLKRKNITHEVLNARQHQREAEIVSLAGQRGAVTIATNMAGRGTDIKLGPGVILCDRNPEYEGPRCPACPFGRGKHGSPGSSYKVAQGELEEPCGLQIIGTERHESRRIDRQLRGRSGRQGDPGASLFYMSLEDDLMRLFSPERIATVMDKLGIEEGEVITHPMVTKAIERAQKRVEFHNFDARQHLLKYDDVMNKQREVVYANRLDVLRGTDLQEQIREKVEEFVAEQFAANCEETVWPETIPLEPMLLELQKVFLRPFDTDDLFDMGYDAARDHLVAQALRALDDREALLGAAIMRQLERAAYLSAIDTLWKDHLRELDHLRGGVSLRAYGQKDPLLEYKSEAFGMFEEMLKEVDKQTLHFIFHAQVSVRPPEVERAQVDALSSIHASANALAAAGGRSAAGPAPPPVPGATTPGAPPGGGARPATVRKQGPKVGRNAPCPCGSGKKYKFCHGAS